MVHAHVVCINIVVLYSGVHFIDRVKYIFVMVNLFLSYYMTMNKHLVQDEPSKPSSGLQGLANWYMKI